MIIEKNKILFAYFLLCSSFGVHASIVSGNVGLIKHFVVYTNYNSGDYLIQVASPLENCEGGFYASAADPGAKNVFAMLQMAYLTKTKLQIWAESDQLFSGSSNRYCHIYVVDYVTE